ncbi:MAG: UTP--glucose-1-phosphate uridylyltransferase GalU [Verrucomicrobiales bacterium]|nr:UTP--glucose-1-phosphate uridylyltransferase GalU [Verrucomicrobiales bacterium]
MNLKAVTKAVIPAAGFGTRFLPSAKSIPKEMLPIIDTPTIQHVVEEAVAAGITDILMVIGKSKRAIEEHFYPNHDLERELSQKGKHEELEKIQSISRMANIHFIWQQELKGLGDAVSYARSFVGDEPFALLLGDTLLGIPGEDQSVTAQLIEVYQQYGQNVVALEEVPEEKVSRYGIAGGDWVAAGSTTLKIHTLVEKPSLAEAPSRLAIASRYVFRPEIFEYLANTPRGKNNEVQLTDAMVSMLKDQPMYGLQLSEKRYDIGNKLDFIKTNIEFALRRDDIGPELSDYIKELAKKL